jgi:hypothetical protein
MSNPHPPNAGAAPSAERTTPRRAFRRVGWFLVAGLLIVPAFLSMPGVSYASAAPVPAASAMTTTTEAWGIAENTSVSIALSGDLNSSLIPSANLTGTTVHGSVAIAEAEQYANYAVLTLSTPNATDEALELQSVVYHAVELQAAVSAPLPVAGTYLAGQTPPTAPVNGSIAIAEAAVSADVAFLNLTRGTNGSLALANEHLELLRAFNVSVQAISFPNVTTSSNGTVTVQYVSGAISASGLAVANLSASFAPAVVLYEGTVPNGTQWSTTSEVSFVGEEALGVQYSAQVPGSGTARWSASSEATVASTGPVTVTCQATTVPTPSGANGTAVLCAASGNDTLGADGLVVVPSSVQNGVGTNATTPADGGTPPAAESAVPARPVYAPGASAPQTVTASVSPGQTVTAALVSPGYARSEMTALRTPATPSPPAASGAAGVLLVVVGGSVIGAVVYLGLRRRRLP